VVLVVTDGCSGIVNKFWLRRCVDWIVGVRYRLPTHPHSTTPALPTTILAYVGNTANEHQVYFNDIADGEMSDFETITFPKNATATPPELPYITYNYEQQAIELCGDYMKNEVDYHFYLNLDGTFRGELNSTYDGRTSSAFLYVEEFGGSIFIGGENIRNGEDLMFAQTEHPNITLPGLPSKTDGDGNFIQISELKYHTVKKHAHKIWMVGGQSDIENSANMIWSLDVRDVDVNGTGLEWKGYPNLQQQMTYSTFQIVNDKLLATSKVQPKNIEIYNLYNGRSLFYENVFMCENDMPMSFVRNENFVVVGGQGRSLQSCKINEEVATLPERNDGFEQVALRNTTFPNELDGKQLLSIEFIL